MTDYERLEALCKLLDFKSMRAFALAAGLKVQTFYDIQAGRCKMSQRVAEAINEKFSNVSVSWLLTGEGDMMKNSRNNTQVIGTNTGTAINGGSQEVKQPDQPEAGHVVLTKEQFDELLKQNSQLLRIIENLTSK